MNTNSVGSEPGGNIRGKRVLVVEDDLYVRKFLRSFLELEGLIVSESGGAADAIRNCAVTRFDLIMLDYNLGGPPAPTGWAVAEEIRAKPDLYGSPRILAMSGTIDPSIARNLGLDDSCFDIFVPKPFDLQTLKAHVTRLLSQPGLSGSISQDGAASCSGPG